MPLRVLFLDLNSYFASVEQQANPALRGRPVVVAPVEADTTFCIAASYEAKKFGIRTGTRISDAKMLCPELVIVTTRTERYVHVHHEIVKAVQTCIPVTKVWSIDEMECRLAPNEQPPEVAVALARRIKEAIRRRVGACLTSSIGLAPNRLLAKLATDMQKPDGLVVLEESDLPHKLYPLKLTDFCGIGPRMERRLSAASVWTVEAMCNLSIRQMRQIWGGVVGERWWHLLRGHEVEDVPTHTGSMSHEHVLPPEERNLPAARQVVVRLLHKAAARARKEGYIAGSLSLFVRFTSKQHWERHVLLAPETNDTITLLDTLTELWARVPGFLRQDWRWGDPMKVGVVLGHLEPARGATLPLFEPLRMAGKLSTAMDALNTKFGRHTVYFAAMHGARSSAPTRIAFGTVPDIRLPA
ncbi:MAG: DUF4113 domain-containing protein [Phycisphaeraceae bacterium]|nr:DUF4113 domain-containing protein [Phycisphaeraceae bacterium]